MSEYNHILTHKYWRQRSRSGIASLRKFVKDSPFLITSFIFHLIILLLLAFITAREPVERRDRIELKVEEVRFEELEMQPMVTDPERFLTDLAAAGGAGGEGETSEGLDEAVEAAGEIEAPRPDIFGMQEVVRAGDTGQWGDRTAPGFGMIAGDGEGLAGAVDEFAVETMNAAARGKTLVVLLIDRTRSVVYLNLPRLIERMDYYFETLDQNLTSDMMENARWLVVSYGRDVTFHTRPINDLQTVKSALGRIQICPSGDQNVAMAINAIMERYGDYGHRSMLLAAMTDGYGSDLRDGAVIERTIRRMRNNNARFFVFGHEAAFASNRKEKTLVFDPELLQEQDLQAVREFARSHDLNLNDLWGRRMTGMVDAGPDSPRRELWRGSWRWGWDERHMPASGFPMYAMNRMVLATEGIYFLLEAESDYDAEKLYARYLPDVSSIHEYDRRMREEPLRAALRRTWEEMPELYLSRDFTVFRIRADGTRENTDLASQVQRSIERAREGRRFANERIRELEELIESPEVRSMRNYIRWRANAQVTIAELRRMQFMLGQYGQVLQHEWESNRRSYRFPEFLEVLKRDAEENDRRYALLTLQEEGASLREVFRRLEGYSYGIALVRGDAPDDFVGPRQAREEYEAALEYADRVMQEHSGTPWEQLAGRIRSNIHPLTCRPRQHGRSGPRLNLPL